MARDKDLSCGVEFMRGVLLVLNVLFVIVGLALIGIGIYMKVDKDFAAVLGELTKVGNFEGQSLGFLAFVMIGGGVFTLLIALFGCVGALYANRCLLWVYAIILLILMIIELVGFIMAFYFKSKLTEVYEKGLVDVLEKGLKDNSTAVLESYRALETAMKCCGARNVSDYGPYPNATLSEPCKTDKKGVGCSQAIIDFLRKNLPIIGGTLGGVLLLELLGLIGAIALAVALKHAPSEPASPRNVLGNMVPRRRY